MNRVSGRLGTGPVRDLMVIGAGGFARESIEAVRAVNAVTPTWRLTGILDDDPARFGDRVSGVPVIGGTDRALDTPDAAVLICTGRPGDYASRRRIADRLDLPPDRYATVVHPAASVAGSSVIGAGSVLLAQVTLTADVVIGRHVAVMPQTVLTHDVRVEDWATLAAGVLLGGGVRIAPGAYLGSGVRVRQDLRIGAWSLVGLGSVVTRDVPDHRVWFGTPARDVRAATVDLTGVIG